MALVGIALAVGGAILCLLDLLGIIEIGTETAQLIGKVSERLIGDDERPGWRVGALASGYTRSGM